MSSRFLKKVSKTYGDKINVLNDDQENVSSEGEHSLICKNKFDLLEIEYESDDEKELDEEIIGSEIKLAKYTDNKKRKKIKKLKTQKPNSMSKFNAMTEDELLEQSSTVNSHATVREEENTSGDALSIKIRNLNENVELQQMYGPSAVNANVSNDHGRRSGHLSLMKCTFGKRSPDWPQLSLSKLGLTMDRIGDVDPDYNWCLVTCSDQYLRGEKALKTVMRSGTFQDHLREWPYHINTLLQMAMLLINQEDFSLAADILKRIFYVYETISPMGLSLLGFSSAKSLSRCNCSLDYKYRLNRGIFLALFQWIQYLCQRSCFTTALEYCKVILNLNVKHDPLAMILIVDDISLRANQFDFLIHFYGQFNVSKSLMLLPNFAFSLAMCHFLKISGDKLSKEADFLPADELLQTALSRFPGFLAAFVENCGIKVDDRVAKSSFFTKTDSSVPLEMLMRLYVKRSINLWKSGPVLKWVECNVQRLLDRFEVDQQAIQRQHQQVLDVYRKVVPLAVKRHVLLSGHGELLQSRDMDATSLIFDPFPPANSEGGFDHYFDNDAPSELDDHWLLNLFRSLMPSFR